MLPRIASALAAALLLASPLRGQGDPALACGDTETLQTCWQRILGTDETAQVAAASGASQAELAGKATGITLTGPQVESALRNFLPLLAGDLLMGAGESDALALEINRALHDGVILDLGASLKVRGVAHDAQLYQPLVDSLLAGNRTSSRDRLQSSLGDLDDVSLIVSLNRESPRWGRSFRQHRATVEGIYRELKPSMPVVPFVQLSALLDKATLDAALRPGKAGDPNCDTINNESLQFGCLQPEFAARLSAALAGAALLERARLEQLEENIRQTGFSLLAELINNQPQLQATGEYRARERLTGPSEWTASARLEVGFANMNGLRRFCENTGRAVNAACLNDYTGRAAVRAALRRSDRAFLAADFSRRESYHLLLPDDTVAIDLEGEWQVTGSAGYGRYLGVDADGDETGRIDARLDFAHYGGDPTRQDRFVASATYTHKVNDQASAVFGFTWASRPELIGDDVTKKVGAHLGLTYKLTQPQP